MIYFLFLLEVVLFCFVLWIFLIVVNFVDDMGFLLVVNWVDDMLFLIVVDLGVDFLVFFLIVL